MEKLNLRPIDIYKILEKYKGEIELDGKTYFFKPNESNMELVVEKIAKLLGINCVHYFTQNIGPYPYYFSADLNNVGNFKTADNLGLVGDSLHEGFKLFKMDYPELEYMLSRDLIKVYMMDILLMNYDRNSDNWGILEDDKGIRLVILDNDLCFTIPKTVLSSKVKIPFYMRKYCDYNVVENSYADLENFFCEFGPHFKEMFVKMYDLLTPEFVRSIFDSVEKEYGVTIKAKEMYLSLYEEHYLALENICKKKITLYNY